MRTVKIAFTLLLLSLCAVIANSIALREIVGNIQEDVERGEESDFDAARAEYTEIFDRFMRYELYLGITVNHNDLTSVEDGFAELLGAIKAEDEDTLITAKSRLISTLKHIRRLAGINIDSILFTKIRSYRPYTPLFSEWCIPLRAGWDS
ncbi:MAG: DUF4363 family protein [Clostridia bacterium]|nr:DUF4363 family protein [Clostridia bacterium]